MAMKTGRKGNDRLFPKRTIEDQKEEERAAIRGAGGGVFRRWGSLWDYGQRPGPVKRIK